MEENYEDWPEISSRNFPHLVLNRELHRRKNLEIDCARPCNSRGFWYLRDLWEAFYSCMLWVVVRIYTVDLCSRSAYI